MKDPLLDKDFLAKLDAQTEHEIYAKIISLTFDENPIEEITGKITSGSVNIDGKSAVRRTCSLTMVAQDVNINNVYWGLNTKFKLMVGLKNFIDPTYPDIIWFKQGTYVITQFNTSLATSSYTISISGKDKMCLLNGDIGGAIESISADFGKYDIIDDEGNSTGTEDFSIKEIIYEAVHHYGKEPFHNIIVQDLDDSGLELMEYQGDEPLYLLLYNNDTVENMIFESDADSEAYVTEDGTAVDITKLTKSQLNNRITSTNISVISNTPLVIYSIDDVEKETPMTVAKIETGDVCGYRETALTYAGDLILSTGDKITSALDKIVSMLGEYEYFYNVDGQFVFRRKHTYEDQSWNTIVDNSVDDDESYEENAEYSNSYEYSFTNSKLISAFQNNPNLANLRNDFSIWGTRNNSANTKFHLRYAIDSKPVYYKNYEGKSWSTTGENAVDWREIIYQMALDYYRNGHEEDFNLTIAKNNIDYYPSGYTGYQQYYADMEGFWRTLYNPDLKKIEITEDNINDLVVDTSDTYYYTWYDDETADCGGDFTTYNFSQVVKKKDIEDYPDIYYINGTISWDDLKTKIDNGTVNQDSNAWFIGTDDNANNMYSCYCEDDEVGNGKVGCYYQWQNEDIYQIYKRYWKYPESDIYYNNGLALDLSDLSETVIYYYKLDDENIYIPGEQIILANEYISLGKLTENQYNDAVGSILLFEEDSNEKKILSTEWVDGKIYYTTKTPTNFDIFQPKKDDENNLLYYCGSDYYKYNGYVSASSFTPGKSYYTKKMQADQKYVPCSGVQGPNSFYKILESTPTENDFDNKLIYIKKKTPIYLLSTDSFDSSIQYYQKNSQTNEYEEVVLLDPSKNYYKGVPTISYNPITEYQENAEYYKQYFIQQSLTEEMYEANHFYLMDGGFEAVTSPDVKSVKDFYIRTDPQKKIVSDIEEFLQDESRNHQTLYAKYNNYVLATDYYKNVIYYIKDSYYKQCTLTEDTFIKNKYYYYKEDGDTVPTIADSFDKDTIYYTKVDKYTEASDVKDEASFRAGCGTGEENTEFVTYYCLDKNNNFVKATSYDSDTNYYRPITTYIMVSNLTEATYNATKDKNSYYIYQNNSYIPVTSYIAGAIYYIQDSYYKLTYVNAEDFSAGIYRSYAGKNIKYYYKPDYYFIVSISKNNQTGEYELTDSTLYQTANFYIDVDTFEINTDPISQDIQYYTANFNLCEDEKFDEDKIYYSIYHENLNITEDTKDNYLWSTDGGIFIKQIETSYILATPSVDDDKTINYFYDQYGQIPVTIYYTNTYYVKIKKNVEQYYRVYELVENEDISYYERTQESPTFDVTIDGVTHTETGYFGDGVHDFYLDVSTDSSTQSFEKAIAYNSEKSENYYLLDEYNYEFTLYKDQTYTDKDGNIISSFVSGNDYISSSGEKITIESDTNYYTNNGFQLAKSAKNLIKGVCYYEYGTTEYQTENYQLYPMNIYYGYTEQTLWDGSSDDYSSDKKGEGDFYLIYNGKYYRKKILHHFVNGNKYYIHNIGFYEISPSNLNLLDYESSLYYKKDGDTTYTRCIDKLNELIATGADNDTVIKEMQQETGITYSYNENLHRFVISEWKSSTTGISYYLYHCQMDLIEFLRYNFTDLPVSVYNTNEFSPIDYWTMNRYKPENLIFWFDFIDAALDSDFAKYGAHYIGSRPKAVNDDDIKAIYYRDTPLVIYQNDDEVGVYPQKTGYTYLKLTDNIDNLFQTSSQGKDTFDVLNSYLNTYSHCAESITITSIPIYYLEPNIRILVYDKDSGINGEYIITKITLPLAYNGTMSISAEKAIDKIY